MNAKISESLGLVTLSEAKGMEIYPPGSKPEPTPDNEEAQASADRQYARENIKEIIEQGTSALETVLDIARATEEPGTFKVYSDIMKSLIEANKTLVSLNNNSVRKASKQKEPEDEEEYNNKVTNHNNLFVGSTQELMELVKSKQKEGDN